MRSLYLASLLVLAFNWHPAFAADGNSYNADNTAVNARDRNNSNPTAENESNRKNDIKSVAKLRRQIMRTNGLSTNAQNIKIISEKNCVILRGPVDSENEKTILDDLARKCCGMNVKNELEVRQP